MPFQVYFAVAESSPEGLNFVKLSSATACQFIGKFRNAVVLFVLMVAKFIIDQGDQMKRYENRKSFF